MTFVPAFSCLFQSQLFYDISRRKITGQTKRGIHPPSVSFFVDASLSLLSSRLPSSPFKAFLVDFILRSPKKNWTWQRRTRLSKQNEYVGWGWSCGFSVWCFVLCSMSCCGVRAVHTDTLLFTLYCKPPIIFVLVYFYEVSDVIYGIGLATIVYMTVQFLRGIAGTFFSSAPNLKKCVFTLQNITYLELFLCRCGEVFECLWLSWLCLGQGLG